MVEMTEACFLARGAQPLKKCPMYANFKSAVNEIKRLNEGQNR